MKNSDRDEDRAKNGAGQAKKDEQTAREPVTPNPPRTTRGKWTAPKFGSAGSGGAELEPGPERD